MNQDTRAQLNAITEKAVDTAIEKLFFFHQNTAFIETNYQQLIELVKVTTKILKQVKDCNIYVDQTKLETIKQLTEELILVTQPQEIFNTCNDPLINKSILH